MSKNKYVIIQRTLHSDIKSDTSVPKKPERILDYNSTKVCCTLQMYLR